MVKGGMWRELSLEDFFERLYRRLGARYVDLLLGAQVAGVLLFVVPGYTALLVPIFDLGFGQYVRYVLVFLLFLGLGCPGTFWIAHRTLPNAVRWVRGDRNPARAPAAWHDAVARLPRTVAGIVLCYFVACLPAAFYVGSDLGFHWYGYPTYFLTLLVMVSAVGVFAYLAFEQAVRPVVRDVAVHLPEGFDPPRTFSISMKALTLIPSVNFFTAVVVAAIAITSTSFAPEMYLGVIAALSIAVSLTVSLVLTLLFRNAILRRIDDLGSAMRDVDEGDYRAHVPALAGDELDRLGTTFNNMVAGLRERESLREERTELVDDLRASRARLVSVADAERRRVERDLHDGAQQQLVLLSLKLAALDRMTDANGDAGALLAEVRGDAERALKELRDLAHGIYPAILESDGLAGALEDVAQRAGLPVELSCDGAGRYPADIEAAVYFCCLEALQNAAKHAGEGATARIDLRERDGELCVEVADDGRGFDAANTNGSAGLQNMGDRIGALGGRFEIESRIGSGTNIRVSIPVPSVRPEL